MKRYQTIKNISLPVKNKRFKILDLTPQVKGLDSNWIEKYIYFSFARLERGYLYIEFLSKAALLN